MTDTPETDANDDAWAYNMQYNTFNSLLDTPLEWDEFARKLERERDEAIAEATNAVNDIIRVKWERDEARKTVESLTTTSSDLLASLERTREGIEMMGIRYATAEMHHENNMREVTEQQDRLTEALREMQYERDRYKMACDRYSEDEVLCKLQEVTEQRDRLAEALEILERTAGLPALHDDPARVQARKALQSLNNQNE
jgi:hypothetical protein